MFRLLVVTLFSIDSCYCKAMIWINHPGLNDYYYNLFHDGLLSSVSNLTQAAKTELCNSSLVLFTPLTENGRETSPSGLFEGTEAQTPFFTFDNQKSRMLYRALYPYFFLDDPDNYDYSRIVPAQNTSGCTTIHVKVLNMVQTIAALPCIEYKNSFWYVIGGYDNEIFFTAESSAEGTDGAEAVTHLTGTLEPFPQFHIHHQKDVRRLEEEFTKSQVSIALIKKRMNLCKMSSLNRFRLCSVVGAAWLHQRRKKLILRRWFTQKEFGSTDTCIEGVKISLGSSSAQEFTQPVDLLQCAVSNATLYLVVDEYTPNAVFSAQRKEVEEGVEYVLDSHIEGIAMLTRALRLSLLVDAH